MQNGEKLQKKKDENASDKPKHKKETTILSKVGVNTIHMNFKANLPYIISHLKTSKFNTDQK